MIDLCMCMCSTHYVDWEDRLCADPGPSTANVPPREDSHLCMDDLIVFKPTFEGIHQTQNSLIKLLSHLFYGLFKCTLCHLAFMNL